MGDLTTYGFLYKPELGATGTAEKALYDAGQDRVDTRLGLTHWVGDPGYGTFAAAVAACNALASPCTLVVPAGTHAVTTNLALVSTVSLVVQLGGIITISNGVTLTIGGPLEAGMYQIFDCNATGKAAYNGRKFVQWWGVKGDGATNDASLIQMAIDSGVGPVIFPNINPNTTNPGSVNGTNYYLGTTALTIIKADQLIMETGTSLVYVGTDAPLVVDCHAGAIEGLVLELYDVYTTGNYCLKVVGDGVVLGTTAYVAHARISAHRFANFDAAGFFTKWCRFVENNLDIQNMYTTVATPDAVGYYFDATDQVANSYEQEANVINTVSVNSRTALYAPGTLFDYNTVNIGTDYGSLAYSATTANMTIGGTANLINIPFVFVNDANSIKTVKCKFATTAAKNVLTIPPTFLSGVVDDSELNSNVYSTPVGKKNFLKNPSFESWLDANTPVDWTLVAAAAQNTTHLRHGGKSAAVTSSGGNQYIYQTLPTELVGQTITISGWFKSPVTNTGIPAFGFADSIATTLCAFPNDGCWHFLSMSYAVPGGATGLQAQIYADIGVVAQTVYADGLFVSIGDAPIMLTTDEKFIYSKTTWDPAGAGVIADDAMDSTTVGCLGAAVGDPVSVGFSVAVPAGALLVGAVTAANTVTVTIHNNTGGNLGLASGTVTVLVWKG